jgi:hypothetical protein
MMTYSLGVSECKEDISEARGSCHTITYFLRVGESEEISETMGTSKT